MKLILTSDTHHGFHGTDHHSFLKKLASEKPDLVVHAGDWITNEQNQLLETFQLFREYIQCPILTVLGNHDFWSHSPSSIQERMEQHRIWFRDFDIHHLEQGIFEKDGWTIAGFDGWYCYTDVPTNDHHHLPKITDGISTMQWFSKKAYLDLLKTLDRVEKVPEKRICVSHFPSYTEDQRYAIFCANLNYLEPLTENFDVILCGHSHKACDFVFRDTQIVNCGSDYNDPKYKILEI